MTLRNIRDEKAWNMIKLGDKAKGFKFPEFRNSASLSYNKQMERFVGTEGFVCDVGSDTFDILYILYDDKVTRWTYPIQEYLAIQRAERLREIGI